MDGTNHTVLANPSSFSQSTGLTLDKGRNRLYWVETKTNLLRYLELDNFTITTLLSGFHYLHHPVGLTLYGNELFWTGVGSGAWTGGIFKAQTELNSNVTKVISLLLKPHGIYAHEANVSTEAG